MPDDLHADLDKIESSIRNVRVMGDSGIRISGSLMSGLKVDMDVVEEVAEVAIAAVVPPGTGACCHDDTCTIETQADCEGMGGTYIGDDSTCDPDPCACPGTVSVTISGLFWCDGSGAVGDLVFPSIPIQFDHQDTGGGNIVCVWYSSLEDGSFIVVGLIVNTGIWEVNFYPPGGIHDPSNCAPYVSLGVPIMFNGVDNGMTLDNNLVSCCPNFIFTPPADLGFYFFQGEPQPDDFMSTTYQAWTTGGTAVITTP